MPSRKEKQQMSAAEQKRKQKMTEEQKMAHCKKES